MLSLLPADPSARAPVRAALRAHRPFVAALAVGTALRVVAMLGYRGVLWFPDSLSYLGIAVRPYPYQDRVQGYAMFLRALLPLHNLGAVAAVQHLLALTMAVACYLVLRGTFHLPSWAATLATVPLLLDGFQLQLEQLLMSDVLFTWYVLIGVVALLWRPRSLPVAGFAGLLFGLASVTRSVGLPLVVVVGVCLLIRGTGWRPVGVLVLCCLPPVLAYAGWFHAYWGRYGLTNGTGIYLYARTTTFVDCGRLDLTPREAKLCPTEPVGQRPAAPNYVWHVGALGRIGPVGAEFTPANDALARGFAVKAIVAQPGGYLRAGLDDLARTFTWRREPYPNRYDTVHYLFPDRRHLSYPGRTSDDSSVRMPASRQNAADLRRYAGSDTGRPTVVEPYAGFIRSYQRSIHLPGTLFGVILVAGLLAMLARLRALGGRALLPWAVAVTLIVLPPFTVTFDYRYVLPAVPLACLAAAIAIGDLRRHRPNAEGHAQDEPGG